MSVIAPTIPTRHMTYAEFLKIDHASEHVEWVDGKVVPMPPVSDEHSDINGALYAWIRSLVEHSNLGVVHHDPFQMKTGPDLPGRQPDILFVAKANLKRIKKNYLQGPADLVIEIVSPESRGRDRGDKFYEYEKGGVKEYWIIDPERKQTDFFVRGKNGIFRPVMMDNNGVYTSTVLPRLWIDPIWFWSRPLPQIIEIIKRWKLI